MAEKKHGAISMVMGDKLDALGDPFLRRTAESRPEDDEKTDRNPSVFLCPADVKDAIVGEFNVHMQRRLDEMTAEIVESFISNVSSAIVDTDKLLRQTTCMSETRSFKTAKCLVLQYVDGHIHSLLQAHIREVKRQQPTID